MKDINPKIKKFPIAFFVFRRPEITNKVLTRIIKSDPPKLYIFADGPRNKSDKLMTNETRKVIDNLLKNSRINVVKIYRQINLGSRESVVNGLDEVFKHEEAVIILEDDCLPSSHFFDFCNKALVKYREDKKINTICGTRIDLGGIVKENNISKYFIPWGWALWRRSWKGYKEMDDYEILSVTTKRGISRFLAWYLLEVSTLGKRKIIDEWDYKMIILQLIRETFSLIPSSNLVSNIGFGDYSSNTFLKTSVFDLPISDRFSDNIDILPTYRYDTNYDREVICRLILTPVSLAGLILRKYFPFLVRCIYRK